MKSIAALLFVTVPAVLVLSEQSKALYQEENPDGKVLQLVEEVRVGELDGAEEYMFVSITGVLPGEDGKFIVADSQMPVIRMYDRDGDFLKQVGREGRGPGEYNYIIGMGSFPDGRFAISDPRNSRLMVYDAQGEALGSHSVQNGLYGSGVFQTGHDGNMYIKSVYPESQMAGNWEYYWKKISPEGETIDTIDVPSDDSEQSFVIITESGAQYPFVERTISNMSPLGYLVTGRNSSYTLEWGTGSNSVSIEREFDPVTVKPEEKQFWQSRGSRYPVDNTIPDTKPAYKNIFTDSQGRIWVWRYVEAELTDQLGSEERWWERPTFDVFLPDGSLYGTVAFPWRVTFSDARDNQVWGILTGEMGEDYAVRYRMEEVPNNE